MPLACILLCLLTAGAAPPAGQAADRVNPSFPAVDLRPTVRPSAIVDLARAPVPIRGRVREGAAARVLVRVTTGRGVSATASAPVRGGAFDCRYPSDFGGAGRLEPGPLFVDATTADSFDVSRTGGAQAEAMLVVVDGRRRLVPDIPSPFTADLLDARGRTDERSAAWPGVRALVNLYMRSRGARLAGVGRPDFDLARPADLAWYRNNLALYDFAHRDRDWATPLGHREARAFWQSVWPTWFNASNDHPIDGNPANTSAGNYRPYAFTNDFADILIDHLMRLRLHAPSEDSLRTMCREATRNLLACQHREPTNFALVDARGKQERYTAGAFRYGLFVNGDYMTEGTGWFHNPAFLDYVAGGVLNGRAVWGLGEALKAEPRGPLAGRLRQAIALALRFCLRDGVDGGYTKRTPQGHLYWRDAGEHAYLVLGMVAACAAAPTLPVPVGEGGAGLPLRSACASALDALVDLEQAHHQWAVYPNVDSMAIAALADGAMALPQHPNAARWRRAARQAADAWLAARVDPGEFAGPAVHFGLRLTPDTMTYRWGRLAPDAWKANAYLFFYQTGHWTHALARLYALTGEPRYRRRAEAMVAYLCGDNPWGVRLMNEMGGVYNWVEDRDGDGIEEALKQDMYPESTAFCRIGLFHLMRAIVR